MILLYDRETMSTPEDHALWRRERRASVTAPTGSLALIETRWTGAERPDLNAERAAASASITVTPLQRRSAVTGETEYGLRRWDAESAAVAAFIDIEAYDYDPAWVVDAQFTPSDGERTVAIEHMRDSGSTRDTAIPGEVTFTRDGVAHSLVTLDNGDSLLLVFGDATNGEESYGSGRFLAVHRDPAAFGTSGAVTLDLNRAFVPPCGFSAQYNCPLPPAQNRFAEPIRAGEKKVVFKRGFDLYSAS